MPQPRPQPFGPNILPTQSTTSHWMRTVDGNDLLTVGEEGPLPAEADVVIIGSGLSGAVTAVSLLSAPNRPQSVVVMDARAICSGASGRNGGHCRPDAFRGFTRFSALHGAEQADKVLQSEETTSLKVEEFVNTHSIDCEFVPRATVDVCLTDEFADYEAQALQRARAAGVNTSTVEVLNVADTARLCKTRDAKAGFKWRASSVNPLKLALGVYKRCLELGGFQMFSYAPVTAVVRSSVPEIWDVVTPRGAVRARQVVHATNGYSKLLLPELDGLVTPFRIQAVRLNPPGFSLEPTMSLRRDLEYFYSVAPQPDDSIVLSCPVYWTGQSQEEYDALFENMDDSVAPPVQALDTVRHVAGAIPGADAGGVHSHWTGIIAWTPDAVPFVGALPGKPGQFVHAGFNGHGMARIFHTAPCLAGVMLGEAWDSSVPEVFQISEDRLAKLRAGVTGAASHKL